MAKGKYARSRRDEDSDLVRRFSRALQEDETVVLPKPTANPLDIHDEEEKEQTGRNMPECDFESFEDLDSLPELDIPELSALDTQSEESEYKTRFTPMPPKYTPPREEKREAIPQMPVKRKKRPGKPADHRGFSKRSGRNLLIGLASVAAAGLLIFGGIHIYEHFSDPYDHLILNGVMAAGVDLSAMTREQAAQALAAAADPIFSQQDMVLKLPDETLRLSPADSEISLRVSALVDEAYSYGRSGSREQQQQDYNASLTGTHEIDLLPFLEADEGYILNLLSEYADAHNTGFIPSSYALEGEQPPLDFENFSEDNTPQTLLLILGNPGFQLDTRQTLAVILNAYSQMDMAPDLRLQSGDTDPSALDLNRVYEEYNIDPVNSSMDPETFDVIPGSYGYTFDLQNARRMLEEAHYGDTIRIPMEYVRPEIMDDEVYFRDVLSSAETPHGDNEKRNTNLRLACEALNGMVLNPGDEFSYNAALGQRTAEKGYQAAPAYSGDQLVNSLGGGICQVSSTLYYSCMLADLEITDRINHGFLPSYIDPGMDATVSWGKPDFKFRNNTDFPIKLQAEATEDAVIIKILGTDTKDYYIKMEYEMSNIAPNEVYEEYDADSGYYDGQVVKEGTVGHYVKSYRCKYSKKTDVLISKEFEARSGYMSRNRVIAVVKGEKPEETTPEETASPESSEPEVPETVPSEPAPSETAPSETVPQETAAPETVPQETAAPEPAPSETAAPAETAAPEAEA